MTIKAHFDGKVLVPEEPLDLPSGKRVVVTVEPVVETPAPTIRDLLASGAVGGWKTRTDIADSSEFARQLRGRWRGA